MTAPSPRNPSRQRGTTLIEALLAFLVVSAGTLALLRAHTDMQAHAALARERAAAMVLAQAELDRLRALPWAGLPTDGTQIESPPQHPDSELPAFALVRTVGTPSPGWRSVDLSVQWQDRSLTQRQVQWHTALAFEPTGWGMRLMLPLAP